MGSFNVFDQWLCPASPWRGVCRTLDLRSEKLRRWGRNNDSLSQEVYKSFLEHRPVLLGLDLSGRSLRFAVLRGAYLPAAWLKEADLRGADLVGAALYGANLEGALLQGADLYHTELHGANLEGSVLRGARFWKTDLHGVRLWGADMTKTVVYSSNFIGTNGIPDTSSDTTFLGNEWTVKNLPKKIGCGGGAIHCYFEAKRIDVDLPLAWMPEVTLLEHLLEYEKSAQAQPVWLDNLAINLSIDLDGEISPFQE